MHLNVNNILLILAYLNPLLIGLLFNVPAVWYGEGAISKLGAIAIVLLFAIGLLTSFICLFRCCGWQRLMGELLRCFTAVA